METEKSGRLATYPTTSRGRNTTAPRGTRVDLVRWRHDPTPSTRSLVVRPFAAGATLADAGEFGLISEPSGTVRPGRARVRRTGRRRRRPAHPQGPRGGLHRPDGRGPALPPRVGRRPRHRPQGGRGQPLRRQRHGRYGALAHRRPGRTGRPARAVGPRPRRRHRGGGRPGRREHRRRRPDDRQRGGRRHHRARHLRGRPGAAQRGTGRATSWRSPAARAGPPRGWPCSVVGSAHPGRWSRPTSDPSRRTPPDPPPPTPARPR